MSENPLIRDRDVEFVLYEVLNAQALCELPAFAECNRETFDLYLAGIRKFSREVLYPRYRDLDLAPPELVDGQVRVHPWLAEIYPRLVELGLLTATRSEADGGSQLPITIFTAASAYLMAANLSVCGYAGLTSGAARLIDSFGTEEQKRELMDPMYEGDWTGTMALTEAQAGSSLADVETSARPVSGSGSDGHYLIKGTKIFISGGDQDFSENIVHLTLARIEGAPPGMRGVSLFAIPKLRREDGKLVPNDAKATGLFHKIGWRGLPSIALTFGDDDNCHGYLIGDPNRGIHQMFQMMNEARLMVGTNAMATAAVAFHESLLYSQDRVQGRAITERDPTAPQVPIIEHADVRRMLLRQKAIVEGSFSLLAAVARYTDLSEHATTEEERKRADRLLELLIPIAKTFPAEKGYESNVLAVQVHGGYGYTSEYLPESWLRDQKLNSIHEGTTCIQSLDLLGRKARLDNGQALFDFRDEVTRAIAVARDAGVNGAWCDALEGAMATLADVTETLMGLGMTGDVDGMLLHSVDYMDLFSTLVIGWQWLLQAMAAQRGLETGEAHSADFYRGKLSAAQYWLCTEVPRIGYLATLCKEREDSYQKVEPAWL